MGPWEPGELLPLRVDHTDLGLFLTEYLLQLQPAAGFDVTFDLPSKTVILAWIFPLWSESYILHFCSGLQLVMNPHHFSELDLAALRGGGKEAATPPPFCLTLDIWWGWEICFQFSFATPAPSTLLLPQTSPHSGKNLFCNPAASLEAGIKVYLCYKMLFPAFPFNRYVISVRVCECRSGVGTFIPKCFNKKKRHQRLWATSVDIRIITESTGNKVEITQMKICSSTFVDCTQYAAHWQNALCQSQFCKA